MKYSRNMIIQVDQWLDPFTTGLLCPLVLRNPSQ